MPIFAFVPIFTFIPQSRRAETEAFQAALEKSMLESDAQKVHALLFLSLARHQLSLPLGSSPLASSLFALSGRAHPPVAHLMEVEARGRRSPRLRRDEPPREGHDSARHAPQRDGEPLSVAPSHLPTSCALRRAGSSNSRSRPRASPRVHTRVLLLSGRRRRLWQLAPLLPGTWS